MVMLPYEYKNVRICDIDGVLLELRPISGYFNEPAVAFAYAKEILNSWFNNGDYVLLWTARPEEYRQLTMQQLDENGFKYHQLLMGKPHSKNCIHIYDDANMEVHKIDKYKGLSSATESVEKQIEKEEVKSDGTKNNSYYDEIVEESRKAGKLVLPEAINNVLQDMKNNPEKYKSPEKRFAEPEKIEKYANCYQGCVKYKQKDENDLSCAYYSTDDYNWAEGSCLVYSFMRKDLKCQFKDKVSSCTYAVYNDDCRGWPDYCVKNDVEDCCRNIYRYDIHKKFVNKECIGLDYCTYAEGKTYCSYLDTETKKCNKHSELQQDKRKDNIRILEDIVTEVSRGHIPDYKKESELSNNKFLDPFGYCGVDKERIDTDE